MDYSAALSTGFHCCPIRALVCFLQLLTHLEYALLQHTSSPTPVTTCGWATYVATSTRNDMSPCRQTTASSGTLRKQRVQKTIAKHVYLAGGPKWRHKIYPPWSTTLLAQRIFNRSTTQVTRKVLSWVSLALKMRTWQRRFVGQSCNKDHVSTRSKHSLHWRPSIQSAISIRNYGC